MLCISFLDDALDVLPTEPLEVESLIESCWDDIAAQPGCFYISLLVL